MSCWNNVIGIRGLCDPAVEPISGLYINDLTGISLADLDSGVNEEDKTAYTLIQRKIDQAANMLKAESLAYLQSRWNYTTSSWNGDWASMPSPFSLWLLRVYGEASGCAIGRWITSP